MRNIRFELSPTSNLPDYISKTALDYWFPKRNLESLIMDIFKDVEFNKGDMFDFRELNTIHFNNICGEYPFVRDISVDFEDILIVKRKTYSVKNYPPDAGHTKILTYELDFLNY
ncbi:MAG: hypothetical protein QM564_13305 [Bergeyella sp.]